MGGKGPSHDIHRQPNRKKLTLIISAQPQGLVPPATLLRAENPRTTRPRVRIGRAVSEEGNAPLGDGPNLLNSGPMALLLAPLVTKPLKPTPNRGLLRRFPHRPERSACVPCNELGRQRVGVPPLGPPPDFPDREVKVQGENDLLRANFLEEEGAEEGVLHRGQLKPLPGIPPGCGHNLAKEVQVDGRVFVAPAQVTDVPPPATPESGPPTGRGSVVEKAHVVVTKAVVRITWDEPCISKEGIRVVPTVPSLLPEEQPQLPGQRALLQPDLRY